MSEESGVGRVSRRDFLTVGGVAGWALISVGVTDSASAAPKKFTKEQAKYQPVPKNGQRCQICSLWKPPASCQVVEGEISPAGWCILYQPKG
jgi:hypothetical protein